jgi:hypothetical protein
MEKRSPFTTTRALIGSTLAVLVVVVVIIAIGQRSDHPPRQQAGARPDATPAISPQTPFGKPPTGAPGQVEISKARATPSPKEAGQFESFRTRPFAAEKSSDNFEWTAVDGRDPGAILELAHNEVEVERLMEENDRIKRRQLVYRKEPAFIRVQRARAANEPVEKITLPGLDGRELEVEVTRAEVDPSGLHGTIAGRLPGRGQSLVTLAFREGREAFTVMSPEDGIFLQGHPREPGEIIVTSFDPDTYLPLPGGEPIKMTQ